MKKSAGSADRDSLSEYWDDYLEKADHVPDAVVGFLISNGICTDHLAHLDLDDRWLYQLMAEYDEALKTLIVRYFTNGMRRYHSNHATVEQFKAFLTELKRPEALQWLKQLDMRDWIEALQTDDLQKAAIMQAFFATCVEEI